jgi:hypothetical protein
MRLARGAAKLAISGVLATAMAVVGGTAAMADDGATTEPATTSSIEVVPGEAVSLTVEFAGDQPLTSDQIDAAVAEVTSELVPAALACGENVSDIEDDSFTLTYYNCSSVSIRLKPDYFFVDGTCKVVSPYGTTIFYISVNVGNSYHGLIRC